MEDSGPVHGRESLKRLKESGNQSRASRQRARDILYCSDEQLYKYRMPKHSAAHRKSSKQNQDVGAKIRNALPYDLRVQLIRKCIEGLLDDFIAVLLDLFQVVEKPSEYRPQNIPTHPDGTRSSCKSSSRRSKFRPGDQDVLGNKHTVSTGDYMTAIPISSPQLHLSPDAKQPRPNHSLDARP